ncbi:MAG: respiratory nitrate reductase subunit gamma, partial [Cyclobacteriaceae bacterium]|nr:respiratory nitrate reductase subunit gamma [Cyclobacteriaceae bacterium]
RVPARLLFLEGSAFAFALLTLLGLAMFVYRRFTNKRVQIVTTRTDLVVYVVLLVQVLTGMGVAYYVRWGSSWFASVLSPYLTSIFAFNPDTGAVSAMPWLVQLHIISAFVIIGIIPFTRFVHFLVAPFDYLWRSYQVVIWNWNRSLIRRSSKHLFGKKTRNH